MGTWTERELATLAEVAETFVRGDARRARLTTEALERAADPEQVRQFHRPGAHGVAARQPDPRAPPDAVHLDVAGGSRALPAELVDLTVRVAPNGLRHAPKLMTFLAYADPGADYSGNPRHAVIGYEPEFPPIANDRTPITPHVLPFAVGPVDEAMTLDADVVVVGSGAGAGSSPPLWRGRSIRGGPRGRSLRR